MKKFAGLIAASALILSGSACLAAEASPVYVKALAKFVMPSDPEVLGLELESDNGYGWGGAVGMKFDQIRAEVEIATQKTDIDAITAGGGPGIGIASGDTRITTYMVNGYYDIPVSGGFSVYLTAGLGMATTTFSIMNVDDDDSGFAWKGGAGVSYAFDKNMAVDFGWEFIDTDDPTIDNVEFSDVYTNNIVAAFRYTF
jgi:opacity protein-like surface antigen